MQIKNGIIKHVNVNVIEIIEIRIEIIFKHNKNYSWNLSICTFDSSSYLKSIVNASIIMCDKIIYVMDILSTNRLNALIANVMSNVSINLNDKKVSYKINFYILHMVLLSIMLLFIIAVSCYHYAKHRSKQKNIGVPTILNWRIIN